MSMPTVGVVSLKANYNAAGDGSTDDTQAIKSFLDYLASNGGTGLIESGVYVSNSYSRDGNAKPFNIIGSGPELTIMKNKSTNTFFTWRNCNGIHIKGLKLDCQYTTLKPTGNNRKHGFVLSSCHNCSVEDSIVYDFVGTGFLSLKQSATSSECLNITFLNCTAQATEAFLDWKSATTTEEKNKKLCNGVILVDCKDSKTMNCTAIDISLFGIELKNNAKWNKVIHCKAVRCVYGFGMGQQTQGDIGCEYNIVDDFQSRDCYIGGILGKAKYNILSNFLVDFSDIVKTDIRNAFRFQLNSRFNSLNNILISGLPEDKVAILYETAANNNVSVISFIEKNQTDNNIIVAQYSNTSSASKDTIGNYTFLYRSNASSDKLKVAGDSVTNNESKYAWNNSSIPIL
ncbi:TPA: hypothetical protein OMU12_004734 [Enterobacter cloacae]|nr:hypothetical protein [Enterobacter cloacae]